MFGSPLEEGTPGTFLAPGVNPTVVYDVTRRLRLIVHN
jgi:hypothetical protein